MIKNQQNQIIGDLVDGLYNCKTLDEKFLIFSENVQKLGFESSSYTFIPNVVSDKRINHPPIFKKSAEFSESFIEQYIEERFDQHDFTIRAIRENCLYPLDWNEYLRSAYLTEDEQRVLFIAREAHGIRHGVSIPVMNGGEGMAGFSMISSVEDKDFKRLRQENMATLHTCARAFHDIVFGNAHTYYDFIPEILKNLSDKEKTVLEFVVRGKTMAELGASRAPVSQRYGEKLLLGLKQKFGGVTTNELIYYVSQLKLI